ncbi:hypothetical protein FNF27_07763 [Cafeteria roenbergensis]|uniref:Acid ceramidase N-terminal domain-containing protein n=1 Tax=Cafeteria roenbergensis TaxID=33653 RepID=A0A5A8CJF5_CAFRO|nr:hypothetical protein FNF29_03370 [Cafeteria roenbergensis]KAA0162634.1 hypothetical protein FNF31_03162 [Cafeteria roenbergensis]KAA0164622.1 hypothetical protein FNF27_07763 [Cafeteria roenbergensis]KAA0170713.1 hypothetical protein FNF28_01257 [Cafeteria roenbergensis]|eukprot:KAA0153182.1 hypothetical protein FNF29_03370 [Cafeteria roenbergensis]
MLRIAAALAICAALASSAGAAYCHGKPNPNAQPNLYDINEDAPVPVRTHANGKAFRAGKPGFDFWVIHVWGTPYERGLAQGQMMKEEASAMVNGVWKFMQEQVEDAISGLPTWFREWIAQVGLEVALDLTRDLTEDFTPQRYYDEMRGLADGAGVDYETVVRIHLIGELTKGDCSLFGAWGQATPDGNMLQLRALDWNTDDVFRNQSAVLVEHPTGDESDGSHPFASVGFVGWLGVLSGYSSQKLAVSEIGIAFPDASFGEESREGVPFTFLLRSILESDDSLTAATHRIKTANRTCDLVLAVGDGKQPGPESFRAFEYSASVAINMTDYNMAPNNDTWHPKMKDVAYLGMDWDCPGYNAVLHRQLATSYRNITAATTIRDIVPIVQTGDTHVAVYDFAREHMYVSFMRHANSTVGPDSAYDRQFTRLDMPSLFNEPRPTSA